MIEAGHVLTVGDGGRRSAALGARLLPGSVQVGAGLARPLAAVTPRRCRGGVAWTRGDARQC